MLRLETVEDFEKARRILDDPKSRPDQFRIRSFGICSKCRDVTEYCGSYNYNVEGCHETCLKCNTTFGWPKFIGVEPSSGYATFDSTDSIRIPQAFLVKLEQFHSREQQRKFFKEALGRFILSHKKKVRRIKSTMRRLAKLRS